MHDGKNKHCNGKEETKEACFWSEEPEINLETTDKNDLYEKMADRIKENKAKFERVEGTGWTFKSVVELVLYTVDYKPLGGGSSYIELPSYLAKKKACVNMKNTDDKCLMYCVARAKNPVKDHSERIDSALKEQVKEFDWSNINFPATDRDIDIFEKQNNSVAINVFGYDDEKKVVYPHRITNKISSSEVMNMMYYEMSVTQLKDEAQKRKLLGYKSKLIKHQ